MGEGQARRKVEERHREATRTRNIVKASVKPHGCEGIFLGIPEF